MTYHDSLLNRVERLARQAGRTDEVVARLHQQEHDLRHARDAAVNELQQLRPLRKQLEYEIETLKLQVDLAEARIKTLQGAIEAQKRGIQYLRLLIDKVRGIVDRDDAMSERLEQISQALDDFDDGTIEPTATTESSQETNSSITLTSSPPATATEKRWFRRRVQIYECCGREIDGKDHWKTAKVWVSGQPANWRQTIDRASGQIPEWIWELLPRQMFFHAETTFNPQTNMMEFWNWEQGSPPAPVAEPLDDSTTTDGAGQS